MKSTLARVALALVIVPPWFPCCEGLRGWAPRRRSATAAEAAVAAPLPPPSAPMPSQAPASDRPGPAALASAARGR